MPFNQITGAKITTQTRPFPTRRFSSILTKRILEMAGYTLNVSGAISKAQLSINETLHFLCRCEVLCVLYRSFEPIFYFPDVFRSGSSNFQGAETIS